MHAEPDGEGGVKGCNGGAAVRGGAEVGVEEGEGWGDGDVEHLGEGDGEVGNECWGFGSQAKTVGDEVHEFFDDGVDDAFAGDEGCGAGEDIDVVACAGDAVVCVEGEGRCGWGEDIRGDGRVRGVELYGDFNTDEVCVGEDQRVGDPRHLGHRVCAGYDLVELVTVGVLAAYG